MNTGLRAAFVGSVRLVAHRLFTQVNRTFVSSSFKMASAECKPIEVGTEGRPVEAKAEVDAEAENEARPEIEKPLPQRPAAVLFDIDGTLTHSDHLHLTVFQELLLELGFPLPEDPDHVQRLDSGVDVISEGTVWALPHGHCLLFEKCTSFVLVSMIAVAGCVRSRLRCFCFQNFSGCTSVANQTHPSWEACSQVGRRRKGWPFHTAKRPCSGRKPSPFSRPSRGCTT